MELRPSPLRGFLAARGAQEAPLDDALVASRFSDPEAEYWLIRNAVGLSDQSHYLKYRLTGDGAHAFLDRIVAANVLHMRYGRILHTFMADHKGHIIGDAYVANDEECLYLLCEACAPARDIEAIVNNLAPGQDVELEDLTRSHALIAVDGPRSWTLLRDLFSSDILSLPYLSVEPFTLDPLGLDIPVMRAGKTGEFGYLLLVPGEAAPDLMMALLDRGRKEGAGLCGIHVFDGLKLEGRFHNIHQEGRLVGDPLALGLQWRMDLRKEEYHGRQAIMDRRARGVSKKIVGLSCRQDALSPGDALYGGPDRVGEVITCAHSYTMGQQLALALIHWDVAYAGLDLRALTPQGEVAVRTISMPPITPKSLTIKLDEM